MKRNLKKLLALALVLASLLTLPGMSALAFADDPAEPVDGLDGRRVEALPVFGIAEFGRRHGTPQPLRHGRSAVRIVIAAPVMPFAAGSAGDLDPGDPAVAVRQISPEVPVSASERGTKKPDHKYEYSCKSCNFKNVFHTECLPAVKLKLFLLPLFFFQNRITGSFHPPNFFVINRKKVVPRLVSGIRTVVFEITFLDKVLRKKFRHFSRSIEI